MSSLPPLSLIRLTIAATTITMIVTIITIIIATSAMFRLFG